MSISRFFRETLGANFRNDRWSWGAVQPQTDRYFLRVWKDGLETIDGREYVGVFNAKRARSSPGHAERARHVEALRQGAEGYGVLCVAKDAEATGSWTIASFDDQLLLRLGEIRQNGDRVFAHIIERVPVRLVADRSTGFSRLPEDMQALAQLGAAGEREALVMARLGQGAFRSTLLRLWDHRCAVSGSETAKAIRASHIKPWKDCTDEERADPYNGLPLVATLDALFDAGLITFGDDGRMMVSPVLPAAERALLGLGAAGLRRRPHERTLGYLSHPRAHVFV